MNSHDSAVRGAASINLASVAASRLQAVRQRDRLRDRREQRMIDAEVYATRKALLRSVRQHAGTGTIAFCDPDFLSVADRPTLYQAIVNAAVTAGRADLVDLQLYDRRAEVLRIAGQHGFPDRFLRRFATVTAEQPTACATALTTRRAVLVDDVSTSEIFRDGPALEPMRDVGSRAVYSYPLVTAEHHILGVLSFHYRAPRPGANHAALVAASAISALAYAREQQT